MIETLRRIERKLDLVLKRLDQSRERELTIMALSIDDLLLSVQEFASIDESLDALFAQLQALISQGGTDPAKLQEAIDLITTHKDHVKAAIVANTPAQP